jgi:hypothetical protein
MVACGRLGRELNLRVPEKYIRAGPVNTGAGKHGLIPMEIAGGCNRSSVSKKKRLSPGKLSSKGKSSQPEELKRGKEEGDIRVPDTGKRR